MALLPFLDRSHTIAKPGFSRWMVPPAALCIHLCIGQAYAFSVFNLPMTKLIGITASAPDDWKLTELGWIFSIAIFVLGYLGRDVRPLGRGRRSTPSHVHGRLVLRRRLPGFGIRRLRPQSLDRLSGLWRAGRLRPRPRLHLAGLDADQMVPRPAGHGHRHGHHGLRRRRLHRLAAVGLADGALLDADPRRRRRDIHRAWHRLLHLHDGRRLHRAGSGAGLEAGRLYAAGGRAETDHQQRRLCL